MSEEEKRLRAAVEGAAKASDGDLRIMMAAGATLVTSVLLSMLRPDGGMRGLTSAELSAADSVLHEIMREVRRGLAMFPNEDTVVVSTGTSH